MDWCSSLVRAPFWICRYRIGLSLNLDMIARLCFAKLVLAWHWNWFESEGEICGYFEAFDRRMSAIVECLQCSIFLWAVYLYRWHLSSKTAQSLSHCRCHLNLHVRTHSTYHGLILSSFAFWSLTSSSLFRCRGLHWLRACAMDVHRPWPRHLASASPSN